MCAYANKYELTNFYTNLKKFFNFTRGYRCCII